MKRIKGFTLIELLSVIVILAIIALIAVPTIVNIITKVRISSAKANFHGYIDAVENASSLLNINTGKVPTTVDELEVEAKNIDNINLISLTFNEDGDVSKAKAEINGLYCTYKENSDVKCTTEMYSYIKNIYNLTDYDKETIQNIYFVDEKRNGTPIDISVERNNTVLLYLEENGNIVNEKNMYDMYIYSEYMISSPTNSTNFFKDLVYLDTLDFNDMFDTSNVTNMTGMFCYTGRYSTIFTLDLGSSFDTSNVISMNGMFISTGQNSTVFTLNLGDKFDTSNVKNMSWMFHSMGYYSKQLTLDLGDKFDTRNVKDMTNMFYQVGNNVPSFTLNLGDKFDTSNVTVMKQMFDQVGASSSNVVIKLGDKFDTTSVEDMSYMFTQVGYNSDTVSLNLGNNFDTSKVEDMSNMFHLAGQHSETFELDLGDKFVFNENVNITDFAIWNGVTKLIIPSTITNIPDRTFSKMSKLNEIVFEHSENDTIILPTAGADTGAFYHTSNINTTVTTVNDTIKNYDWLSDNRTVTFN